MAYHMPDPADSDPMGDPELRPLLEAIWEDPGPLIEWLREQRASEKSPMVDDRSATGSAMSGPPEEQQTDGPRP